MPVLRRQSHGWTLPGYKYLGPFNSLNLGEPTNPLDAAARKHDIAYTDQINKQLYPYLFFNKADQELIDAAKTQPGLAAYLTHFFFSLKKKHFPHQQIGTKRKGVFINKALQAKKARQQGQKRPAQTNLEEEPSTSNMTEAENDIQMQDTNNPAGGGGGGRGGGGVGHSTGNYNNQTFFHYENGYCYVTAHSTRHIYLNQAQDENYILIEAEHSPNPSSPEQTQQDNYHAQIKTPWSHIDANAWGCWFAPSDFQRIITEAEEIFLESFEHKIFNISIKTATDLQQGQTVYNNDLIATLQVALDSDSMMPYTPEAPRSQTINFIPWNPFVPPIYNYYIETINTARWNVHGPHEQQGQATRHQGIDQNYQFFAIEHKVEIDLLRTGDEWTSGIYKFKCKPVKNLQLWQSNRTVGKPPNMDKQTSEQAKSQYNHDKQYGIHWGNMGVPHIQNSPNESDQLKPYDIGYQTPFWNFADTYGGPHVRGVPPSHHPREAQDLEAEMSQQTIIIDYAHGYHNPERLTEMQILQYGTVGQAQGDPGGWVQTDLTPARAPYYSQENRGSKLFPTNTLNTYNPYVAFNNYDIQYPNGQIWDKKITTEHEPQFSYQAPFKCENAPPGQLFVKLTPQYTNQVDPNKDTNPKIDTFCSFFWTGTLKLKYKIRGNRQFNPYFLPKVQDTQAWSGKPTWEGHIQLPYFASRVIKDIYY